MDFEMAFGLLESLERASFVAYAIVLLSVTTSMNIAELLGLRRKRVNLSPDAVMLGDRSLDGRSIAVRENFYRRVFGTVKKKSRKRDLPIPRAVLPVLQKLMGGSKFKGPDDLVFCTDKGTPLDEKNLMNRTIKPAAKKLGMPWMGWHVFRHTHSTLGEDFGMAFQTGKRRWGIDYHMTMQYTHSDLDRRRRALDVMADRLVGRTPENGIEPELERDMTLKHTKRSVVISVSY
jgi:integrase